MYKVFEGVILKNHATTFTSATTKGSVCPFISLLRRGKHLPPLVI